MNLRTAHSTEQRTCWTRYIQHLVENYHGNQIYVNNDTLLGIFFFLYQNR